MDALAEAAALDAVDGSSLDLLAQRLRVVARLLRDLVAVLLRGSPPEWSGAGRRSYDAAMGRALAQLRTQAGALETASSALGALGTTLRGVQAEVAQARRIIAVQQPAASSWQGPVDSQLRLALQAFDDADRRAAAVVMECLRGLPQLIASSPVALPPGARAAELIRAATSPRTQPSDAVAVALWWSGLSRATQARLRSGRGGRSLAELDGIPDKVRDAVNRMLLAGALKSAEQKYARAAHGLGNQLKHGLEVIAQQLPWPFSSVSKLVDPDLRRWRQRVDALRDLTLEVSRPGSELLSFDPAGDGRAVVASGDVEAAADVAVVVPGLNSTLDNLRRLLNESDALAGAAGAGSVVVAWLGYDAPNLLQVASDGKAKTGARELNRFTAGLRATAQKLQHLTVIGHSYGTLVAGIAARSTQALDDLVLLASPGIEAKSVRQLKVPAAHVWVARAGTDPIQVVFWPSKIGRLFGLGSPEVFGPDPAASSFGATRFSVDGAYGHSGYFRGGSQSLRNLARIVDGRPATR